jgi:hypothetical protein
MPPVVRQAPDAFYVSALLQHKGWRYHSYPSMGTGTALLGSWPWTFAAP